MVTQKVDPKHPLFKKIVRSRFIALLFGIPGLIWFAYIVITLDLDHGTQTALLVSSMLVGNGFAYYLYSLDANRDLKKELRLNASQNSALSKRD